MSFDPIPLIIKQVGLQVDLTQHEKALRELLRDAHEVYEVALEDWYTRADPSKPKERLQANWDPEEPAPEYDYGEDAGKGLEDWPEFWKRYYYRRRGYPGVPLIRVVYVENDIAKRNARRREAIFYGFSCGKAMRMFSISITAVKTAITMARICVARGVWHVEPAAASPSWAIG